MEALKRQEWHQSMNHASTVMWTEKKSKVIIAAVGRLSYPGIYYSVIFFASCF